MPLAIAYFLSALCGSMTSVAVSVHFATDGQTAWVVSATLIAGALMQVFGGPVLAPLFDKHSPRTLAISAALLEALLLGLLAAWPHPLVLIAGTMFSAALSSVSVPALLLLADASSTSSSTAQAFARMDTARLIGGFAGPFLGGLLVQVASLRAALGLELAASLILAGIVAACGARTAPQERAAGASFLSRIAEAPRLLFRNPQARGALSSVWTTIIFTSTFNVALVFFAIDVLHAGGLGYAALTQAFVLGRIVGARAAGRVRDTGAHQTVLLTGLSMGAAIAVAGALPHLGLAIACFAAAGICNAVQVAALRFVVMGAVPEDAAPKALSAMGSVNSSAMLVGYVVGSPIVAAAGPAAALVVAGVGTLMINALGLASRAARN